MNGVVLRHNGLSELLSALPHEDMKWAVEYLQDKIRTASAASGTTKHYKSWHDHMVSEEVMSMTFRNRKEVSGNYKEELTKALEEKYKSPTDFLDRYYDVLTI